ncbi:hypothetical protein V9L05_02440 [Bernardetia sp. Wsw4-3y2]|uniref:hypothetical protein n=1 Tax=Bernardetia sp. Wsw4-3y2 TaxID=3127471 RepID=UPI0030D622D8
MKDFSENVWTMKSWNNTYVSTPLNDNGMFDYQEFETIQEVFEILDESEKNKQTTALSVYHPITQEDFGLHINFIDYKYSSQNSYELNFVFAAEKRLKDSPRHTDFSYYLNELLPRLEKIGCGIYEIECSDF